MIKLAEHAMEQIRAAFDVGSGQTKVTIAKLDPATGRPVTVLFEEETAVLLGHDLAMSKSRKLSDQILQILKERLIGYRDLARNMGATEMAGVATAVFRESSNGAGFIEHVLADIGINLKLITQEEEGQIGLLTATIASGLSSDSLVAWDSGGASFQISAKSGDALVVYEGAWGASKALAAMVERVQCKDFARVQTANPASGDDVQKLRSVIATSLQEPPQALADKITNPAIEVVAIGGPYSPFNMAQIALGKSEFDVKDVEAAIFRLVGKSDKELARFPECEMLIPRLTLVCAVMEHFSMRSVKYCTTTGSTLGILASPRFWS